MPAMPSNTPQPVRPEDLSNFVSSSDPQISPQGDRVLYTRKHVDDDPKGHSAIWIARWGKAWACRSFTAGSKDRMPRWAPDGRSAVFVRGSEEGDQLWMIDADGGEATALTRLPQGSIAEVAWSPRGDRLAISYRATSEDQTKAAVEARKESKASDPPLVTEDLWYRLDGDGYFGAARFQLLLVDAQTGRTRCIWKRDTLGWFTFDWAPNGQRIAMTTNTRRDAILKMQFDDIVLLDVDTRRHQRLGNLPRGPKDSVRWSPDGMWLAWAGRDGGTDPTYSSENLDAWICDTRGRNARCLTSDSDECLAAVVIGDTGDVSFDAQLQWCADSKAILVRVGRHGCDHLWRITRGGSMRRLTSGNAVHALGTVADDGRTLAMSRGSAVRPTEIVLGQLGRDRIRISPITRANAAWVREHAIAKPKSYWIRSADGNRVQAWVLLPPGASRRKRIPAVLQVHGGPHAQYGHTFFHEFQCLVGAGYAVVYANPRGSKGYGRDHCAAIRGDWGGADWRDIEAVIEFMAKLPEVDQDRMGIMGGSYGGYMTNWAVGHTNVFKGAITDRCVSNLVSMSGNSDFPDREDDYFPGNFWSRPEDRWRCSPIRLFGEVQTPMLIIHSEGDLRCNIEQGEQVFAALKLRGIEARFVRYPRSTSHGLSRGGPADLRIHRLGEILRWWKQHL